MGKWMGRGEVDAARINVDAVGAARNAEKNALIHRTFSGSLNERRIGEN
jgi:hypothetical protein